MIVEQTLSKIKGQYNYFVQIEPNYWIGYIWTAGFNKFGEAVLISKEKFVAKQHYIGFWPVWYYNTNKLVFDYEFKTLEDIVNLIDFNIRLGIKY